MFKRFLEQHSFAEYKFRSDIYPTVDDRAFWEEFQNPDCIKEAEREIDFAWPTIKATDFMEFKKSGNRVIMENPHFARRDHLTLFAIAELQENKGRFIPQIVNGIFAICEETYWGLSAHWPYRAYEFGNVPRVDEPYIDLFAAETAEHLAMISSLLRERLTEFCPEILDRIDYEIERRIKVPYLTHRDWDWMGYHRAVGNWNTWILSNLLTVFLLTEKNEQRLHRALKKMFTEIQVYYNGVPEDGGCDEGPDYWSRAGYSLFDFVRQIKLATDGELDLFDDEKLGLIAAYLKKAHMVSDLFVNVADAHASGHASMFPGLFAFARETKQEELMNFSAAAYDAGKASFRKLVHTVRNMRILIDSSCFLKEIESYSFTQPIHGALELLPSMQLAVLREGEWALSVKGGHNNERHNHNDVGSITLYEGTTPVLVDVGIGIYSRFTFDIDTRYTMVPWTRSRNHNLPEINGVEQKFGAEFRADKFDVKAGRAQLSFADAYPSDAGIKKLERDITLFEDGMSFTDHFTFADTKMSKVSEVLVSALPVRVENGVAVIGEHYKVSADCGTVATEFLPFEDTRLEYDWKCKGVTRITFNVENVESITVRVEKI